MEQEAYEFIPGTCQILEQGSDGAVAKAQLCVYMGQSFVYNDRGVNPTGMRVIEIEVHGVEQEPILAHQVSSTPYQVEQGEKGVVLVSLREGGRKGTITTDLPT